MKFKFSGLGVLCSLSARRRFQLTVSHCKEFEVNTQPSGADIENSRTGLGQFACDVERWVLMRKTAMESRLGEPTKAGAPLCDLTSGN